VPKLSNPKYPIWTWSYVSSTIHQCICNHIPQNSHFLLCSVLVWLTALLRKEPTEVLTDQLKFRINHKYNDKSMAAKDTMKLSPN
jgi:hypothetical protein